MDTYAFKANIRYGLEAKGSLISIKISFFIGLGHMAVLEQDFIIVYIIIIYIFFLFLTVLEVLCNVCDRNVTSMVMENLLLGQRKINLKIKSII